MRSLLVDRCRHGRAGQILENRRGEFCLTAKLDLVTGTVSGHRDGFGFVVRDDGEPMMSICRPGKCAHCSTATAWLYESSAGSTRAGPKASSSMCWNAARARSPGSSFASAASASLFPTIRRLSHRILIPKGEAATQNPARWSSPRFSTIQRTSSRRPGASSTSSVPGEKGIATDIAIHSHAIPYKWPTAVRKKSRIRHNVPANAKQGRTDLRDVDLVTIDGADARDFDDAVYCEKTETAGACSWRSPTLLTTCSVGSALDKEAIRRGTSVYFPDRVVPMLPEVLSNGLCSLNPKVDRLCMVCDMRVSRTARSQVDVL